MKRQKEKFFDLGPIYDEERDASPDRIHDIAITDDLVIYAGENDNHYRSGISGNVKCSGR